MDVQPRLASSSGGKTSDEIVDELAASILVKLPDKLDIDKALPAIFEVSNCCTKINRLLSRASTVLAQIVYISEALYQKCAQVCSVQLSSQ